MILDNICDKRKEQLERDISKVSRQDIKAMSAQKEYQTVSFSKAVKRDTLFRGKVVKGTYLPF